MLTIPPFCPNPDCTYHHLETIPAFKRKNWFHKDGNYQSKVMPQSIQRFVCINCGKRFSSQTFSLDYGVKTRLPYQRIFEQINTGSGIRALARNLGVTDKVIINRISRLARQAIALHALLREQFTLLEDMTADGFESFTGSQYYPNNIHLAVGKTSQYLYGIDYAHIRRKGRMTETQKKRREELEQQWRAPPGDIARSFFRLIRQISRYCDRAGGLPLMLYTDEKQEYRRALSDVPWMMQQTIPSTAPRTLRNELFAVNYYDREIRKDQSNHARETVEFSRDVNNAVERLWIYGTYHNYEKPFRVGVKAMECMTYAERAGIPAGEIRKLWKYFFTRRFFVTHLHLSESERYSWYRCYATPLKFILPWYPRYAAP